MKVTNISINISELDLSCMLNRFLVSRSISVKGISITEEFQIRNISYKIFKNISLYFVITGISDNKLRIRINKVKFSGLYIPKYIVDLILKIFKNDMISEDKTYKNSFILDISKELNKDKFDFKIEKVIGKNGFIHIDLNDIYFNPNNKKFNNKNRSDVFLKLTQTTLRLSGDDLMSFIRDFVKSGNFMISGIDISQAVYLKGIVVNSFEVGDVSINIKDLKENLIYIQVKIINSLVPGVNIEHIPIKIFVKDLLSMFSSLNLDLDVNSVRFIDNCIEVKINNFNLDMRSLSSGGGKGFLK